MKEGLHSEHHKRASLGKQDPVRHQKGGGVSVVQGDSIRALTPPEAAVAMGKELHVAGAEDGQFTEASSHLVSNTAGFPMTSSSPGNPFLGREDVRPALYNPARPLTALLMLQKVLSGKIW